MSERTVNAANITPNATEDVICTLFEFLGPVTHLQLKDSPYNNGSLEATIEFQDHQAAMTALHLSGIELGDRILVISFYSRVTTLNESGPSETTKDSAVHVYQLSSNVIANDLPVLFSACGPITKLALQEDPEHAPSQYATIEFATKQGADAAIHFNGRVLKDKPIKVYRPNTGHGKDDGTHLLSGQCDLLLALGDLFLAESNVGLATNILHTSLWIFAKLLQETNQVGSTTEFARRILQETTAWPVGSKPTEKTLVDKLKGANRLLYLAGVVSKAVYLLPTMLNCSNLGALNRGEIQAVARALDEQQLIQSAYTDCVPLLILTDFDVLLNELAASTTRVNQSWL